MSTSAKMFAWANLGAGTFLALLAASPWAGVALGWMVMAQPSQVLAAADQPIARWWLGIAGGVWAGWGATMSASLAGATPAASVWRGLLAWVVLDSLASGANGAWLNVLVNLTWFVIGWFALRQDLTAR